MMSWYGEKIDEVQYKQIEEFLEAAPNSPRLNDFETSFVASLAASFERYDKFLKLTEKQWETIRRIETKIYGAG